MRSDPHRNIRHGMGVPLYLPGCHTLSNYFKHMQSRPGSLYILPRVYGIMVREGCNTSVPPGAGGLIPPSHLVKGGMLQGGVPLQRRYSRGQGVCLPLLPFPLTMRVLGNTRLIAVRKPNSTPLAINLWPCGCWATPVLQLCASPTRRYRPNAHTTRTRILMYLWTEWER